jgi:type I restriction enzyme S subunit
MKLKDIAIYVKDRVEIEKLSLHNYISTENMLPEKGGVQTASSLPSISMTSGFRKDDILTSNIRPYFKKIWIANKEGGCSNDVLVLRAKNNCHPKFLYYVLSENRFFDYSTASAKGTKMPRGDKSAIMEYKVPDYCVPEQIQIADILSSLDDKIAFNKRINDNLEQQAQALFKSWFVDFEPFKDGKFVDSELGMIPEGWKVCAASDIFDINIGKTPPRKEQEWFSTEKNQNVTWVSISDMGNNGMFISDSSEYLTKEAVSKFNIIIVPNNTILLSFKLTIGRVAICNSELTTNEAIARFYLPNDSFREYLYLALKDYDYTKLGSTSSIATAVNSKIIKNMLMLSPGNKVIQKFSSLVNPLFETIKLHQDEICNLSLERDTLLPKLMSGELKINDLNN